MARTKSTPIRNPKSPTAFQTPPVQKPSIKPVKRRTSRRVNGEHPEYEGFGFNYRESGRDPVSKILRPYIPRDDFNTPPHKISRVDIHNPPRAPKPARLTLLRPDCPESPFSEYIAGPSEMSASLSCKKCGCDLTPDEQMNDLLSCTMCPVSYCTDCMHFISSSIDNFMKQCESCERYWCIEHRSYASNTHTTIEPMSKKCHYCLGECCTDCITNCVQCGRRVCIRCSFEQPILPQERRGHIVKYGVYCAPHLSTEYYHLKNLISPKNRVDMMRRFGRKARSNLFCT